MKKTEILSTAITKETKQKLETIAKDRDWTLSHLVNKILEEYQENTPKNEGRRTKDGSSTN